MCGIVGIYTKQDIKKILYSRLLDLQHRGQDSYGYSDGTITEKYMGLINVKPQRIKRNIAIGHTRYRTSGEIDKISTQPISRNGITLVHNGNVHLIYSNSDTHALLDYIIENKSSDIIETIRYTIDNVEGSFFVLMIYEGCLYAFKDKNGIRPGCYGKKGDNIIFSSENSRFEDNDIEMIDDVQPGEIIKVDTEGNLTKHNTKTKYTLKPCIFEYIYLSNPESTIYGLNVKEFRLRMAEKCVKSLKNMKFDAVCGIPSSSRIYALEIANLLKVTYFEPMVQKKRSFIMPTQEEREKYVKNKFRFADHHFNYENILIVDDSIVRGTVSKSIITKFKEKRCDITFLSCSPKILSPNRFGINISSKKELVTYNRTHEQIEEHLGCKIIYQNIDNLYECSGFENLEISKFLH